MIPVIGSDGWFLIPLRSTKFSPAKLARVKIVDGFIVNAFAREQISEVRRRRLHWAAEIGSWAEVF